MIIKRCSYCKREFEGYTEEHAKNMLIQHILSQHRDRVMIQDKDGKFKKLDEEEKE